MTTIGTVIAGVTIFVLSQFFVVLFLERIRIQARCVEDVAQAVTKYSNVYTIPSHADEQADFRALRQEAATELRRLSALLGSTARTLSWYPFWEGLKLVIPQDDVLEASRDLIFLSNSCNFQPGDGLLTWINRVTAATEDLERRLRIRLSTKVD